MVDQAFEALPSEPTEHLQVSAIEVSEDGQSLTIEATAIGDRPAQLFLAPLSESGHVFGVAELAEAEDGDSERLHPRVIPLTKLRALSPVAAALWPGT